MSSFLSRFPADMDVPWVDKVLLYVTSILCLQFFLKFWPHWVFVGACGLFSSCGAWAPLSSFYERVSHRRGFSCHGAPALGRGGFSSWGARAYLLQSLWDLPGPGVRPGSPALAGGFLTPGPPGGLPLV